MRKQISLKARFDVFKRDGFTCQYCGRHPPDVLLEVDHVVPVCEGGGNDSDNLVTACFPCNRGKGGTPLSVAPKSLAEKAEEIKEAEAQLAGYREIAQARADRIEADGWRVADILFPGSPEEGMRNDWFLSIKKFNRMLPLHTVMEAAEIASSAVRYSERKRFLYFCKVCWNIYRAGEADGANP